MKNNITEQLGEALEVLKDYPGIIDILDLDGAQRFLNMLSKSNIVDVPNFKELTENQIEGFIKESENSVEDWINALNELTGVGASKDMDDTIIWGGVPPDLASLESGTDKGELYFHFRSNNYAIFQNKEGTWKEIYIKIVEHVNEKLIVPTIPI